MICYRPSWVAPIGSGIKVENAVAINECTILARITVVKDAPAETVALRLTKQGVVLGLVDLPVRRAFESAPSPPMAPTPPSETAQVRSDCPLVIEDISWRGAYCVLANCEMKGAFSIDVRNTGDKTVTAVNWDFYLIDSVRQTVYDHFKLVTNDKKIMPGPKKIRLTKRFDYHLVPYYLRARAAIMKVTYSDGSTWTRPKD